MNLSVINAGSGFSATSAISQKVLRRDDNVKLHIPQCSSLDATSQDTSNPSPLGEQVRGCCMILPSYPDGCIKTFIFQILVIP